ncbi:MAG TPA: hypothetical protein ENI08_00765 [Candidatus Dependentiae bacterium]|nr:hypothetical protein [Candidatus Dependentiae bacterium]
MFSMQQKKELAEVIEKKILSFNHPEMPKEKPSFKLHVDGGFSWADIEPNWTFEDKEPSINPFNEAMAIPKEEE